MADLKIRKVNPVIVKKLDEAAKKKNISREEYLRKYLSKLAVVDEVEKVEDKYNNLVSALAERLELSNEIIEANNMLLEKVLEKMNDRYTGGQF